MQNDEKCRADYHCGPPSAARRVTVDDAVLSAPLRHLPRVTIHNLHSITQGLHIACSATMLDTRTQAGAS